MILVYTVLLGLAAFRLWKLIADDDLTEPLRARMPEWMLTMTECPWCLGSHIAFGLTWATDAVVGLRMPVLVGLAAAVVTGWVGENL